MPKKFLVNATTGQLDLVSQIALAPVGSSPNGNGATLTTNQILNLELADASNPGLITAAQFNILSSGTPYQMAAYNSSGVLGGFPGYYVDSITGGINGFINFDPPNTASYTKLNSLYSSLNPTQDSPNNANVQLQLAVDIDPSDLGFDIGSAGLALRLLDLYASARSTGNHGSVDGISLNMYMGDDVLTGGSIAGFYGANTFLGLKQGFTAVNNISGYNLNTSFDLGSTVQSGFNGFPCSVNVSGDFSGGLNYYSAAGTFNPSNVYGDGISVFNSVPQISGTVNNILPFNDGINILSTAVVSFFTGVNESPNFNAGAAVTGYQGVNVNPSATGAIIDNSTGVNINMGGIDVTTSNSITALNINTATGNLTSTGVPTQAINSQGLHSFYAGYTPNTGASGFLQLNTLGAQLTINSGAPLNNTFGVLNLINGNILFNDDIGPDPSGFGLGITVTGSVGQIAGVPGKTIDTINYITSAVSVPGVSTGGTVANLNLYNALGAVSAGGTLSITNLKGYVVGPLFTSLSPTNAWGISIEDPNAENYIAGSLAIGTATAKVSAPSIGLEILTKDVLIDGGTLTSGQIIDSGLTANTAVYADVNKQLTSSATTDTELGYVSGVTSSIQTQLNGKLLASPGDINETVFNSADNQAAPVNVTGLLFANATVRSAKIILSVTVNATANLFEAFELQVIQRDSDWLMSATSVGDNSGYTFSITTSGQIQYVNNTYAGFTSAPIHFRALVTGV